MTHAHELGDGAPPASSAEAMLAGTLALMTGYAQVATTEARCLMADRICAALSELADDADLSVPFRMALSTLQGHWQVLLSDYSQRRDH